ncbi:hypothetical protein ACI3PF_21690, partial [Lactococcus lactis]
MGKHKKQKTRTPIRIADRRAMAGKPKHSKYAEKRMRKYGTVDIETVGAVEFGSDEFEPCGFAPRKHT